MQEDGKTNNVSFKTTRINVWKAVIINYFGKSKTNVNNQKTGCVIKTSFDTESDKNNTVKINLFNTGSVVIQGAKCTKFADLFLDQLRYDCNIFTACLTESDDVHQTEVKTVINPSEAAETSETEILQNMQDLARATKSLTKSKGLENLKSNTPIKTVKVPLTPKERVSHHSKSLDSKFDEIHTTLRTIDNNMTSFVEKLGELNMITSSIPESIMSKIKENLATDKRKVIEHLKSIESKLRHSATSLDSLQTKANGMDTQLRSIISKQEEHTDAMGSMTTLLGKFVDRVEKLEDKRVSLSRFESEQEKFPLLKDSNINSDSAIRNETGQLNTQHLTNIEVTEGN